MIIQLLIALGAVLLVLVVWAGGHPSRHGRTMRLVRIILGALVVAVALGLGIRGQFLGTLALVALAGWLAVAQKPTRSHSHSHRSRQVATMSVGQARAALGVGPEASRAEIHSAWRRLIAHAHPDQGGSHGLAAYLNAARDKLLK
jgi:hypothetical protein